MGGFANDDFNRGFRAANDPSNAKSMHCVGADIPEFDWDSRTDEIFEPTACERSSSRTFNTESLSVRHTVGKTLAVPRSRRATLDWSGVLLSRLNVDVGAVASSTRGLPSVRDINRRVSSDFVLSGEANRQVFVPWSAIRPDGGFSPIQTRSDSSSIQLLEHGSLGLSRAFAASAIVASSGTEWGFASIGYTISSIRDFRTVGNGDVVRTDAWSRSALDVRHRLVFQAAIRTNGVVISLFTRVRSGMPLTPLVDQDIDGDLETDRAFVFAPPGRESAIEAEVSRTEKIFATRLRGCLRNQVGLIAQRNSCEGPWSVEAFSIGASIPGRLVGVSRRLTLFVTATNPLGGLERLIHGGSSERGWSGSRTVDPVLLRVESFDRQELRYRYSLNKDFGISRSDFGTSFQIAVSGRIRLGMPPESQIVRSAARLGNLSASDKVSRIGQIKERFISSQADVFTLIAESADSIGLTEIQIQALNDKRLQFIEKADPIWTELATYFVASEGAIERSGLEKAQAVRQQVWNIFREFVPGIKQSLSPSQLSRLPFVVKLALDSQFPILFANSDDF